MRRASTLALIAVLACSGVSQAQGQGSPQLRRWVDRDGESLPFSAVEEVEDFLRNADIVSDEPNLAGTSGSRRLELERDGVRARASFKTHYVRRERVPVAGRFYRIFYDSGFFEVAAYELGLLLGLDAVPPAVTRSVNGDRGAVQLWIENAFSEDDRAEESLRPPSPSRWHRQRQVMNIFDALVRNDDRHTNNILIDSDWNLWMIDHSRSFQLARELREADDLNACPRALFERLRSLQRNEVVDAIAEHMEPGQITALFVRRDDIVEHFERLIAEKGEERILYDAQYR